MRIGVDLGGTKIEVAALNEHGKVVVQRRMPTPKGRYKATVRTIAGLIGKVERDLHETCTVGVATPGAISPDTGRIKNSNSTCLIGQPFQEDLENALGRPVRIANDADCFALSEARDGAAAGAAIAFGVILGTGVGGGIVVNNQLLSGVNRITGEWGHNPLPWRVEHDPPETNCYCGRKGCIEMSLSGLGLKRDHQVNTGQTLSAKEIANRVEASQGPAVASMARYEHRLARALAQIINILDPHVIVLGGGLSNIGRLYGTVPTLWREWVFSDTVHTVLVPAKHGDSSGVRGAAWLWDDEEDEEAPFDQTEETQEL